MGCQPSRRYVHNISQVEKYSYQEAYGPQRSPEKSGKLVFRKVKLYENKYKKCLSPRQRQTSLHFQQL